MQALAPIHQITFELLMGLKGGESLASLIPQILQEGSDECYREFQIWWRLHLNKSSHSYQLSTDNRRMLVEILEQGLQGLSIIKNLEELYDDLRRQQEEQMQNYLERLPFRLLLPLLLCFFPAFLILLFGPLLIHVYLEALG